MDYRKILLLSAAGLIFATGQTELANAAQKSGICKRDVAAALAGQRRISDRRAKRLTGAKIVRQVKPGEGMTMDFREERVTIEADPKTGKIIRAFCG